jgi:molybdopterin-synthase adenylyltransferase
VCHRCATEIRQAAEKSEAGPWRPARVPPYHRAVSPEETDRYARQRRLTVFGEDGQERLRRGTALVVGCGGLGGLAAELLVRAGVGRLRLVDPDRVSLVNLHRQLLFTEDDARRRRPKAQAAGAWLRQLNAEVPIEALEQRLEAGNVMRLLEGVEVVVDGSDNLETRYLLNDACLERGCPWVYGGAVGTSGMTVALGLPGGPCLRCLFPDPAPPSLRPSSVELGVLGSLPALVASLQASLALRILLGEIRPGPLLCCDAWEGTFRQLPAVRAPDCPACGVGRRDFLGPSSTERGEPG